MDIGDNIAIVGCSNGRPPESREAIRQLKNVLEEMGLRPVFGEYLYAGRSVVSGTGAQRAGALMDFYRDPEIKAVFDISGGDVANEILPYLDFHRTERNAVLGLQRLNGDSQCDLRQNRENLCAVSNPEPGPRPWTRQMRRICQGRSGTGADAF